MTRPNSRGCISSCKVPLVQSLHPFSVKRKTLLLFRTSGEMFRGDIADSVNWGTSDRDHTHAETRSKDPHRCDWEFSIPNFVMAKT